MRHVLGMVLTEDVHLILSSSVQVNVAFCVLVAYFLHNLRHSTTQARAALRPSSTT
jgi:hypothetical protein